MHPNEEQLSNIPISEDIRTHAVECGVNCDHNHADEHVDRVHAYNDHEHSHDHGEHEASCSCPDHSTASREVDKPHVHTSECGHLNHYEAHHHVDTSHTEAPTKKVRHDTQTHDHLTETREGATATQTEESAHHHEHGPNCGHVEYSQAEQFVDTITNETATAPLNNIRQRTAHIQAAREAMQQVSNTTDAEIVSGKESVNDQPLQAASQTMQPRMISSAPELQSIKQNAPEVAQITSAIEDVLPLEAQTPVVLLSRELNEGHVTTEPKPVELFSETAQTTNSASFDGKTTQSFEQGIVDEQSVIDIEQLPPTLMIDELQMSQPVPETTLLESELNLELQLPLLADQEEYITTLSQTTTEQNTTEQTLFITPEQNVDQSALHEPIKEIQTLQPELAETMSEQAATKILMHIDTFEQNGDNAQVLLETILESLSTISATEYTAIATDIELRINESGIEPHMKERLLEAVTAGQYTNHLNLITTTPMTGDAAGKIATNIASIIAKYVLGSHEGNLQILNDAM